jgi:pyruvate/2-oxoglutarate dehydrogenase complex dihydrolipoamide acyltransferase (E2) component
MGYYRALENPSSFRKLAAAMWHAPNDPHIFGSVDIDMTRAEAFLADYNRRHGCKATITHLVTRVLAVTLAKHPDFNAKIGWWQIHVRRRIDIFCQVTSDGGRDLSGYKLQSVDTLPLAGIAAALSHAARDIREDRDPAFRRSRGLMKALPLWAIRLVIGFMSFLTNTLNLHLPKLGMPRDPFGSAMVTSVGMLGIDTGFAPFTPIARCPMIITVTRVRPRPWVVGDRVEPRPVLRLCGTFDHRVIDGFHAGVISGEIERLFYQPEALLTPQEVASSSPPEPTTPAPSASVQS